MVSICCITYNQEKYIREAIESCLMQKVNFKYEIIIHDDASTDGTASIIKEYEDKYPNIIRPIYQKENQYSKGRKTSLIAMANAKGKYVAFCEGDDYWTDKNKLQLQVNYMEEHPECTLCFHNADILYMKNNTKKIFINHHRKFYKKSCIYNAGELDLLEFIPTASLMFKMENVKKLPDDFEKFVVGDRPLRILMASYGYAYYIDKIMSIYRRGSGNSAIDKIQQNNVEQSIDFFEKMEFIVGRCNQESNYRYNEYFTKSKKILEIKKDILRNQYRKIIKDRTKFELLGKKEKINILIKAIGETNRDGKK